jgi:hypothetical protein
VESVAARPSVGVLGIAWDAWLLLGRWWRELLLLLLFLLLASYLSPSSELHYWSPKSSLEARGLLAIFDPFWAGTALDAMAGALGWLVFVFAAAALAVRGAATRIEHAAASLGRALARWRALLVLALIVAVFDSWLVDVLAELLWQRPGTGTWSMAAENDWLVKRSVLRTVLAAPCLMILLPLPSVLVRESRAPLGAALRCCWDLTRGHRLRLLVAVLVLYAVETGVSISQRLLWDSGSGGWGLGLLAYVVHWPVWCVFSLAWALWSVAVYDLLVPAGDASLATEAARAAASGRHDVDVTPLDLLGRAVHRLVTDPLASLVLGAGVGVFALIVPLWCGKEIPSDGMLLLAWLSLSAAIAATTGASVDRKRWLEHGWRALRLHAGPVVLAGLALFLLGEGTRLVLAGYFQVFVWSSWDHPIVTSLVPGVCAVPGLWCCARLSLAPAWIAWGLAPPAALAASVADTRGAQWLLTLLLFVAWITRPVFVWLLGSEPSPLATTWGGICLAVVAALAVLVAGETWRAAAARFDPRAFD